MVNKHIFDNNSHQGNANQNHNRYHFKPPRMARNNKLLKAVGIIDHVKGYLVRFLEKKEIKGELEMREYRIFA